MNPELDGILGDWIESLDDVHRLGGAPAVRRVLEELAIYAQQSGIPLPTAAQTPYLNTIPPARQPPYPGDLELERQLRAFMRWNAMAIVVRANRAHDGLGGHIATYASSATLYEVGFHHVFRGPNDPSGGDHVYIQGHATPGIYARAYLEGRLTEAELDHFRRELADGGGLSSYPHPWLMPRFWQFPTVSMGLGPMLALYHARLIRYLENRKLVDKRGSRVFAFLGDGEGDEPETFAQLSLAARERLDNLVFVVNCNLQRLDGPVRGNGKVVQEYEAKFRAAGWNVIKVLWGSDWDPIFALDHEGKLARLLGELVDGDIQRYKAEGGAVMRARLERDPAVGRMFAHLSDAQLGHLSFGGHDPLKVHAAYAAALAHHEGPSVILAQTTKGYGMGTAGEALNTTHQQKKLKKEEIQAFRDRFHVPVPDDALEELPYSRPPPGSPAERYLHARRAALGGSLPAREDPRIAIPAPSPGVYAEFAAGTGERRVSTTGAFVRLLGKLMAAPELGPRIVPIIPDESRTFGLDALFREKGIYSAVGQLYEPVDAKSLLRYREATDGQILQEGINEAGAMSSFIAAGTAYATLKTPVLPFYMFYSMFGPQRVGDQIWAAADARTRGFLIAGTAGRTTLNGEGLQHQDGHSHVIASTVPTLRAYDPAYAYELAVIVEDGVRRMMERMEDTFYYVTVYNESYAQPPMPPGVEAGILDGIYRVRSASRGPAEVSLFGSGPILNEALAAREVLEGELGISTEVWSVTSYTALHRAELEAARRALLDPGAPPDETPLGRAFAAGAPRLVVAASDNVKSLPDLLAAYLPAPLVSLGTDGFGRSDTREALRRFFEVDRAHIAYAAVSGLARRGHVEAARVTRARELLGIDPTKPSPFLR